MAWPPLELIHKAVVQIHGYIWIKMIFRFGMAIKQFAIAKIEITSADTQNYYALASLTNLSVAQMLINPMTNGHTTPTSNNPHIKPLE